jgi:sec-independent protein translocase protein TatC
MIGDSNKDLFEDTRMSFGEHLEDLRKALFKAAIGLAIGCVIGFTFANQVVEWLNRPLVEAIGEYRVNRATKRMVEREGYVPTELQPWLTEEGYIPRQVRIDPAHLLNALREVVPDLGATIKLDPYGFTPTQLPIDSVTSICKSLAGAGETQPQQSALFKALNLDQQQNIKNIGEKSSATAADQLAVLKIFNSATRLAKFSDDPAFAETLAAPVADWTTLYQKPPEKPLARLKQALNESVTDKTVEQTDRDNLNRRMNRALIASMFPNQMPPLRMNLMPIEIWEPNTFEPQSLAATDGFFIWLKAGVVTGLCIAFPWIFYCIWDFVAAGLYPNEKKYVHYFAPISTILFLSGIALAYFFVFAPVLSFLFSFNEQLGIAPEMRINDWLSFVLFLPLGFGVAFQLPLVMLFMNRIGLFSIDAYLSKWRIAVMIIFVLAMLLTPADPISMLLLAIPLTILYFLGIVMCRFMPGYNPNPFGDVPPVDV